MGLPAEDISDETRRKPGKGGYISIKAKGAKFHPPIHKGCDCFIVPEAVVERWRAAKTVDEAEQWAKDNLKTKITGFKGAELGFINTLNRTIDEAERRLKKPISQDIQIGKIRGRVYAQADREHLYFRKRYVNLNERLLSDDKYWMDAYKTETPYHAVSKLEGVIWHEIGHGVESSANYKATREIAQMPLDVRKQLLKISGYSGEDYSHARSQFIPRFQEAWAEAFSAYANRSEQTRYIPKEVMNLLKEVIE